MIIPIHAANPGPLTGTGNWTYLLPGRAPVLIDAGVGEAVHLDAIAGHVPDGPAHVIVTHAHGDHASGAVPIAERWPDTRFSKLPWTGRDELYKVPWHALADGAIVEAGDSALQVVHTPGHAPDHICLWHEATRTVLCGDLVVRGSTVVIPASTGGSLSDYLHSLRRVLALAPLRLLPAHGARIDDPEAVLRKYLEHRREREMQVLAALEAGLRTVEGIAERIYVGLAAPLLPMARESVLAHLLKLEHDGLARRADDVWYAAN